MRRPRNDLRAATVILTIIVATIFLGFLMSALFKVALMAGNFNDEGLKNARAKYAALAAINRAFYELEKNPDWREGWDSKEPLHQNPNLRYKLKVLEDVDASKLGGKGGDKVASGTNEVYLFAQGFTDEGAGKALAAMGGTAYRPGAAIAEACFADGRLMMSGGTSDGFDSRIGDHWYNPTELDVTKQTLVELSGHVGGNRDLEISGTTIDGNVVMPKPEAFSLGGSIFDSPGDVDIDDATILGVEQTPGTPREVAEIAVPFQDASATTVYDSSNFNTLEDSEVHATAKVLDPGAYQAVSVPPGTTLELQSGVYYFKETLALDNATIVLNGSGPVKVYVGETFYAVDANVSPSGPDPDGNNRKPADLQFLFADKMKDPDTEEDHSNMVVHNSTINAVAIGAKLRVDMEDSNYFGAIQADDIRADRCNFHYDKALENLEIDNFSKWKLRGLTSLPPGTNI